MHFLDGSADRLSSGAIEAFSCFEFEDGSRFLIADVSIVCDDWVSSSGVRVTTSEHGRAKLLAISAIGIYPIGCFVLNVVILFKSRHAITTQVPTPLSAAAAFLHRDFRRSCFWWE